MIGRTTSTVVTKEKTKKLDVCVDHMIARESAFNSCFDDADDTFNLCGTSGNNATGKMTSTNVTNNKAPPLKRTEGRATKLSFWL